MWQLGQSLRDARERRGLSLADCEAATRVRARHLAAIEDERWEALPEPPYVRGFLRSYARLLDVDEERVLVAYAESRGEDPYDPGEHALRPLPEPRPPRRLTRGLRLAAPWGSRRSELAWVIIGLVGAIVVLIWAGARDGGGLDPDAGLPPATAPRTAAPPAVITPAAPTVTAPPVSAGLALELRGLAPSGSWVSLHRRDAAGPVLFEGTLAAGERRSLRARGPLWLRVGWTGGLQLRLDGRALPLGGGTATFLITRSGARPAPSG